MSGVENLTQVCGDGNCFGHGICDPSSSPVCECFGNTTIRYLPQDNCEKSYAEYVYIPMFVVFMVIRNTILLGFFFRIVLSLVREVIHKDSHFYQRFPMFFSTLCFIITLWASTIWDSSGVFENAVQSTRLILFISPFWFLMFSVVLVLGSFLKIVRVAQNPFKSHSSAIKFGIKVCFVSLVPVVICIYQFLSTGKFFYLMGIGGILVCQVFWTIYMLHTIGRKCVEVLAICIHSRSTNEPAPRTKDGRVDSMRIISVSKDAHILSMIYFTKVVIRILGVAGVLMITQVVFNSPKLKISMYLRVNLVEICTFLRGILVGAYLYALCTTFKPKVVKIASASSVVSGTTVAQTEQRSTVT